MSVSCPSQTALTDNELNQTYGNGTTTGLLPASSPGASDRDSNGILSASTLNTIISGYKNKGIIPTATATNTDAYTKNQATLLQNIQSEYCFYYSRYKYALEKLLGAIRQSYSNNTSDNQSIIQKYLKATQILNQKVNDFVQIVSAVTADMLSSTTTLQNEISALNAQMKTQQDRLEKQNEVISSSQAVTKLNKEMIKYTEEKARYTDNLLKLYSVMNIVALGLLVYVYKSSSS
jgi:hypothetical protein